ncbi:MAG: hypothetical protein GXY40_11575 [Syntrophomonadaceae bacterium]|nr:hypothetical protein [Syntrophomonadaceae bacterium]
MERRIETDEKIRVFISSICGNEKYDTIRRELKRLIEDTRIAKVYLFEKRPASTLTAEQDYLYGVDDSDVCVFLIDNADGVPEGVLREYQRAKAYPKKTIYIFCNENQKEPTHIQNEITGAKGAKYYITDSFQKFITLGYDSFINDVAGIYINYCKGRLIDPEFATPEGIISEVDIGAAESLEKQLFKNMDKTKEFITKVLFSRPHVEVNSTCDLDSYCVEFLQVLFGNKTIKEVNTNLMLLTLEEMQSPELNKVVVERWKAIQYYWLNNLDKAIECENQALLFARELQLPNWLIQDILIDLRNLYVYKGHTESTFLIKSPAQEELDNETTALFYPLLDRYEQSLYEEILNQDQKTSTQSPYTVTWGSNIDQYGGYIANIYVMAFFNGSLTHILRTFDRIKDVAFSLCSQYDDWEFRLLLLKMAMIKGDKKEVKSLIDLFNDVYGKMNALDAKNIYEFNSGAPINYQKEIAKLQVFQHLGYFFSDEDYLKIVAEIIEIIKDWIESEKRVFILGDYIFEALKANIHRLDNQIILEIVLRIFGKGLRRFYDDTLEVVGKINFKKISGDIFLKLIEQLKMLIEEKSTRESCRKLGDVIISLRKQQREQTEGLHESVIKYMSDSYKERYFLEILVDSQEESKDYINKYLSEIKERNSTQGKDGRYSGYMDNPYDTIANIINYNNVIVDSELMGAIINVCKDTLYLDTQLLSAKVEAIKLITFLGTISMEFNYYYQVLVHQIIKDEELIFKGKDEMFLDKTSKTTLYFNFIMMKLVFKAAKFDEVIGLLGSYAGLEEFEKLEALKTVISMFEKGDAEKIDSDIMLIIFQFALQLSYDKNHDIRYYAVKALLHLINDQTKDPIMRRISEIMDFDSVYIKNMILNNADRLRAFDLATYEFIKEKGKVDNHYVIRNWVLD